MAADKRQGASRPRVLGVIPARYGSTRFPGKPLADIAGKPMIQWVYERAAQAGELDEILVATDHELIAETVSSFGGKVIMTSPYHATGTDRLAEVAQKYPEAMILINIQGDEPLLSPDTINAIVAPLLSDKEVVMTTACTVISCDDMIKSPDIVKVLMDKEGNALYFSRSPIPYFRQQSDLPVYKHIGLYGYRRDFLLAFTRLQPAPPEVAESLEQLRALYYGYKIRTVIVSEDSVSVDTPGDLQRIKEIITTKSHTGGRTWQD